MILIVMNDKYISNAAVYQKSHLKGYFFTKVKHNNKDEAQIMRMLSQIDEQDHDRDA